MSDRSPSPLPPFHMEEARSPPLSPQHQQASLQRETSQQSMQPPSPYRSRRDTRGSGEALSASVAAHAAAASSPSPTPSPVPPALLSPDSLLVPSLRSPFSLPLRVPSTARSYDSQPHPQPREAFMLSARPPSHEGPRSQLHPHHHHTNTGGSPSLHFSPYPSARSDEGRIPSPLPRRTPTPSRLEPPPPPPHPLVPRLSRMPLAYQPPQGSPPKKKMPSRGHSRAQSQLISQHPTRNNSRPVSAGGAAGGGGGSSSGSAKLLIPDPSADSGMLSYRAQRIPLTGRQIPLRNGVGAVNLAETVFKHIRHNVNQEGSRRSSLNKEGAEATPRLTGEEYKESSRSRRARRRASGGSLAAPPATGGVSARALASGLASARASTARATSLEAHSARAAASAAAASSGSALAAPASSMDVPSVSRQLSRSQDRTSKSKGFALNRLNTLRAHDREHSALSFRPSALVSRAGPFSQGSTGSSQGTDEDLIGASPQDIEGLDEFDQQQRDKLGQMGSGDTAEDEAEKAIREVIAAKKQKQQKQISELGRRTLEWLDGPWGTIIMTLATIFCLWGDDIRVIGCPKSADIVFVVLTIICLALFILEFSAYVRWKPDYNWTFFFVLDFIAIFSLIPDLPFIWTPFMEALGQSASASKNLAVARAGRASRAGTRAGRLVRFVRLVRFFRLSKLYKYCGETEEERAAREEQERREEEERRKRSREESLISDLDSEIGKGFSDYITKCVILIVLFLMFLLPLLEVTESDSTPELFVAQLDDLMEGARLGAEAQTGPPFDHAIVYQAAPVLFQELLSNFQETMGQDLLYFSYTAPANASFVGSNQTDVLVWHDHERIAELRSNEIQTVSGSWSTVWYSVRTLRRDTAIFSMCTTFFVTLLLAGGAALFSMDAHEMVIFPIERMFLFVTKLAANPLGKIQPTNDSRQPFETQILENTFMKLAGLLQIGFGAAGAEVISHNMQGDYLDPMVPGRKIFAIFGFCDIRQFGVVTEALGQHVMVFVNQIAEIVHALTHRYGGAANKNMGNAFLLVWKPTVAQMRRISMAKEMKLAAEQAQAVAAGRAAPQTQAQAGAGAGAGGWDGGESGPVRTSSFRQPKFSVISEGIERQETPVKRLKPSSRRFKNKKASADATKDVGVSAADSSGDEFPQSESEAAATDHEQEHSPPQPRPIEINKPHNTSSTDPAASDHKKVGPVADATATIQPASRPTLNGFRPNRLIPPLAAAAPHGSTDVSSHSSQSHEAAAGVVPPHILMDDPLDAATRTNGALADGEMSEAETAAELPGATQTNTEGGDNDKGGKKVKKLGSSRAWSSFGGHHLQMRADSFSQSDDPSPPHTPSANGFAPPLSGGGAFNFGHRRGSEMPSVIPEVSKSTLEHEHESRNNSTVATIPLNFDHRFSITNAGGGSSPMKFGTHREEDSEPPSPAPGPIQHQGGAGASGSPLSPNPTVGPCPPGSGLLSPLSPTDTRTGPLWDAMKQLADQAMVSFLETIQQVAITQELAHWRENDNLKTMLAPSLPEGGGQPSAYEVDMGFGLHVGWAIEGAIGSIYKIDASYLSPNVNIAARLCAATKQYGVRILISGPLYSLMQADIQKRCRWLDRITVKGSKLPLDVYTFDIGSQALQPPPPQLLLGDGMSVVSDGSASSARPGLDIPRSGAIKLSAMARADPDAAINDPEIEVDEEGNIVLHQNRAAQLAEEHVQRRLARKKGGRAFWRQNSRKAGKGHNASSLHIRSISHISSDSLMEMANGSPSNHGLVGGSKFSDSVLSHSPAHSACSDQSDAGQGGDIEMQFLGQPTTKKVGSPVPCPASHPYAAKKLQVHTPATPKSPALPFSPNSTTLPLSPNAPSLYIQSPTGSPPPPPPPPSQSPLLPDPCDATSSALSAICAQLQSGLPSDFVSTFNEATRLYIGGRWRRSMAILEGKVLKMMPNDKPARVLLDIMKEQGYKAPKGWKGYRALTSK